MPDAADNSIVEVRLQGLYMGQVTMLTLHYRFSTIAGPWEMTASFTNLNAIFDGAGDLFLAYSDATNTGLTDLACFYQVIKPVRYLAYKFIPTTDHGTHGAAYLPPNVAHAITLRAVTSGRTSRGTKHIGAQPTSFTEDGFLTADGLASMNGLRDQMIAEKDVNGDGSLTAIPVIYHRSNYLLSKDIFSGDPQPTTRVERRRTVGLGT